MVKKGGVALLIGWFVGFPIFLYYAIVYNYINLTGYLNFHDITTGKTEELLLYQLTDDAVSYLPISWQPIAYQGIEYILIGSFILIWIVLPLIAFFKAGK